MRWDRDHESRDVVDARGRTSAAGLGSGGLFALFRVASMFGWKGVLAAAVLVGGLMLFQSTQQPVAGGSGSAAEEEQFRFVSFVLDDVQQGWERALPGYERAELVVYRGGTTTACGFGQAATGPFYCPGDQRVYLDLSFFGQLAERLGAPGDFAQAYVIAHEIGHHVQHLQGTEARVRRGRAGQGAEGDSVRLELQADCFAGVWAAGAAQRDLLEVGDLEEGLRAASAIGDDRLQRQSSGAVVPDSFTHGTSAQRQRWLRAGYEAGTPAACDTFGAAEL